MGYLKVCDITKKYLNNAGYTDVSFESGYMLLVFSDVKIFFYPENAALRITSIPTDRKYNIKCDKLINFEGIGDVNIKYQPNKSNSELMFSIKESQLNLQYIDKIANFMLNNTSYIFSKIEN